jgi:WD40 repeat protein
MLEYALVASLIAMISVGIMTRVGAQEKHAFCKVSQGLQGGPCVFAAVNTNNSQLTTVDVYSSNAANTIYDSTVTTSATVVAMSMSSDNRTIVVANADNNLQKIDVLTGTVSAVVNIPAAPASVAVTGDGKTALAAAGWALYKYDLTTNPPTYVSTVATAEVADYVAIAPNGLVGYVSGIGSCCSPRGVQQVNISAMTVGAEHGGFSWPVYGIAFTPDSSTAYVSDTSALSVTQIDVASDTTTNAGSTDRQPGPVVVSSDGNYLYTGQMGGFGGPFIDVFSVSSFKNQPYVAQTPAWRATLPAFAMAIWLSPDGTTLYAMGSNSAIYPVNLSTHTVGPGIMVGGNGGYPNRIVVHN